MFFLLKKEIRDFLHSYKSILIVLLSIAVPILYFRTKTETMHPLLFFLFIQMSVSQFVYDSCGNDKLGGGNVFIINCGYGYFKYFASKVLIAFIMTLIIHICSLSFVMAAMSLLDVLLVFLSVIYSCALMFIGNAVSQGEETATAAILTLILIVFLYVIFLTPYKILKLAFVIILDVALYFVGKAIYNSLYFRKLL